MAGIDVSTPMTLEDVQALGIYDGVANIWIAMMTAEDTADTPPEYETPELLGEGITVTLTPVVRAGTLYAGNRKARDRADPDGYTLSVETAAVPPRVRRKILGRQVDAKGVEFDAAGKPPLLALLYETTRDDGTSLFRWLYKGRASERTATDRTRGENYEWATPTIEFVFWRRSDTAGGIVRPLKAELDTSLSTATSEVIKAFTEAVYAPTAVALPLFWDRLSPGGVLMIHDVNSTQFRGPGKAVNIFCQERGLLPVPICDLHGSVLLRKEWKK